MFLPGWEEGLLPHQRSLDDQGRAGLEEERRLAHVGLTRARRRAKIYFTSNRRIHGCWSSSIPSRFLDELPEAHVEVTEAKGGFGGLRRELRRLALRHDAELRLELHDARLAARAGAQGARRIRRRRRTISAADRDRRDARALPFREGQGQGARPKRRVPLTIEGELVAKSTGTVSPFTLGDRVFHQKFGNGNVTHVDGNKLTIAVRQGRRKARGGQFRRADLTRFCSAN